MIRSRAQGTDRLQPRAESARGNAHRPHRPGRFATCRADHLIPLIRSDYRPHGLGILSQPKRLTRRAPHRLERNDHVYRFDRDQRSRLPLHGRAARQAYGHVPRGAPVGSGLGVDRPTGAAKRSARCAPTSVPTLRPSPSTGHFTPQLRELGPLPQHHLLGRWRCLLPYLW